MVVDKDGNDAEQNQKQHDDQQDEAVAGDAFFVAQRAQSLDAAGGEIGDEPRIGSGRAAEMLAKPAKQSRANRICARRIR